jgi:hypothetical protein
MSLPTETNGNGGALHDIPSHVAHDIPMDIPPVPTSDDSIYDRIPPYRKSIITCVVSFCGFLAPMSSTTVLSAIPEVASSFNTTGSIIDLTNAVYLIFMGFSPCFWGPLSQVPYFHSIS